MSNQVSQVRVKRVLVIALGLIGGSFAAGLRLRGVAEQVLGYSRTPATVETALAGGIIDRGDHQLEPLLSVLEAGDVVFVAAPTLAVSEVVIRLAPLMARGVVVTDGASVKGNILRDVEAALGEVPGHLVLGHPIAGSEKNGVDAANPDLYQQHRVILTPHKQQNLSSFTTVKGLWECLGAEVSELSVDQHDKILAGTSHLPHALAFCLVDALVASDKNQEFFKYAAGGFRDFTRIASSDALMWHDIMLANQQPLLAQIDGFMTTLSEMRKQIAESDGAALLASFQRAKAAREVFLQQFAELAKQP